MSTLFPEPQIAAPQPTVIQPRPYQEEAIANAFWAVNDGSAGALVRLPTGTGKTFTAAMIADLWLQQADNRRVLVLAHERQLVWQFRQEIEDVLHIIPAVEMSDRQVNREHIQSGESPIVIASRQTIGRVLVDGDGNEESRLFKYDPKRLDWLLIIDEVHRWSFGLKQAAPILTHFD